MSEENRQQQSSAESTVAGAAKTGKAIASIAKGAATGGAHGAAVEAAKSSKKWIIPIVAVILLPVLIIAMLPSVIFGSLFGDGTDTPNGISDDTVLVQNLADINSGISMILSEGLNDVLARIDSDFAASGCDGSENITEMAEFLLFLLDEREKLSAAIHQAKGSLPLGAGLDGEVSLNGKRQEIATLLRHMAGLRNGEVLISNGGVGYRFNNEGNQVSYRCDVKRVTTINFDRNKIRKMCADLSKKSDETSAALDAALVNTPVEYEAPFDVNETFAEAFEAHMSALS